MQRLEVPACVLCGAPSSQWRVCPSCRQTAELSYIWPFAAYNDDISAAIHQFKFAHARAAAVPLGDCLDQALPYLPPDWTVVPIPTAPARVRTRGYDQALLLARYLAKKRGLKLARPLRRTSNARQLGATRADRKKQAAHLFTVQKQMQGAKVLLVDDVCTTGATLQAAAGGLARAGAAEIAAVVVAWKI